MPELASDFLLKRLTEWNIKRIFGFPGDGINGILGALERHKEWFEFVQVRHEEMAAFMACAHAKFTGEVGVCMATSGPGAIHLLNGLYDAKMDHQPVVAIVGQTATTALGGSYQQEVDLPSLFKDVAGEYVQSIVNPMQVRQVVDRAFRIAQAERTVTCIIFPKDVQDMPAIEKPPHKHNTVHTSVGYSKPYMIPTADDLRKTADILNSGKRVALLVGQGAKGARKEIEEVADLLGAGVAKALLGKQVLPDTLPYVTGCIGLLGTKPSSDMMQDCDTLLMVGTSFPYSEFLPKEGHARGIQIDIDPRQLGIRFPTEMNLQGDSLDTLRALIPLLQRKTDRGWRKKIEDNMVDWWKIVKTRALATANPINPEYVAWELSARLPDNCIVTADAGTSANWYGRDLKFRDGMMGSLSGSLASMGGAVPYAISAKFAYPDRPVICFTGDGAMQMNGINELITVKKYWQRWQNPTLLFIVLNNRDLNQVSWEMRVDEGNPRLPMTQAIPDFPYARYGESLGFKSVRVERQEDVGKALDFAFAATTPTVIDAYTDPDVPTLPPHITFREAKNFMSTLAKGDPNEGGILRQSVREVVEGIFPTR